MVKWSPLREEHFRGKPVGYYITYFPADSGSDINFVNIYFASNSTILANLTAYTMYVINVSAVGPGGVGPAKTAWAITQAAGNRRIWFSSNTSSVTSYSHKRCSSAQKCLGCSGHNQLPLLWRVKSSPTYTSTETNLMRRRRVFIVYKAPTQTFKIVRRIVR